MPEVSRTLTTIRRLKRFLYERNMVFVYFDTGWD